MQGISTCNIPIHYGCEKKSEGKLDTDYGLHSCLMSPLRLKTKTKQTTRDERGVQVCYFMSFVLGCTLIDTSY